ncbi:MAG: S49 family peptidase, partial [Rhizobiales bacterium]|nr:S49 family peptidase [Hyphomicrobiales bacterium]
MTTNKLSYILERFTRPLFLTEEKAQTLWMIFANKLDGNLLTDNEVPKIEARTGYNRAADLCQRVVADVAIIQIVGSLVHRGSWIGASSGLVSYQGLTKQFEAAENDETINTIILEFDSGGGEVGGLAELANKIRASSKKTIAIANSMAASAAFYLSAACDEIHVTEIGAVGSIGVVMVHKDFSKKLEMDGIKITTIYAGKDKIEGWSHKPLSEKHLKNSQDDVDQLYQNFTEFVAGGIDLSQEEVIATDARMFMGEKAIEAKLALSVTSVDELIKRFTENQPQTSGATKETMMSKTKADGAPDIEGVTQADHDAAVK